MSEGSSDSKASLAVIKFLELCLSILLTCLHYYSYQDRDMPLEFLATGTFCGYIIILIGTLADWIPGYLLKARISKRVNMFYSLIGTILFLATGILLIEYWEEGYRTRTRDIGLVKGVVSLITGILFLMDTIFMFRLKK